MKETEFFKQASELQKKYQGLIEDNRLSKKAMCDLCIPFRDKYGLTDLQTLRIARKEMDLSEMVSLAENVCNTNCQGRSEWISADDRLPEEERQRILVTDGTDIVISCRGLFYRGGEEGRLRIPANYGNGMYVTHWMPLPKPPTNGE